MPLVSVVIPVYNTEMFLDDCLESVLAQTHSEIEVMCVDDGSTDSSLQIIKKYAETDARVVVVLKQNRGVVSARKEGVKRAKGEYICFVDSDDTIEPNMIQMLLENIGDADLISCGVRREIDEDRIIQRNDLYEEGLYVDEKFQELLKNMIYDFEGCQVQRLTPWGVNKLYVAKKVSTIMERMEEEITYAEDSVFLYRYLLDSKAIRIIHEPLYRYRYRTDSAIHKVNNHILIDINRVYLALLPEFEKHIQKEFLCIQLQRWIAMMTCIALNEKMGFDSQIVHIPEFQIDGIDLKDKKIALYGAGKCGQDVIRQLHYFGYDVSIWIDRNFCAYQKQGYNVESVDKLKEIETEVVVVAVGNEEVAKDIKRKLVCQGIKEEKIVWQVPRHIF